MTRRQAGFDRVRPRTLRSTTPSVQSVAPDAEGKRALFSAVGEGGRPGVGAALVECSRCGARTVLAPAQAVRAAIPSLHLALRIGHRDDVRVLGLRRLRRDYPTYMRCPACRRLTWVRFTLQV